MYAAQQDIVDIYGLIQLMDVGDRDNDGVLDVNTDSTTVVDTALQGATDEIDSYLSNRYLMPLQEVPPTLRDKCVDLAMYRLAGAVPGQVTDDRRARYKDAIAWLIAVRDGKIDLGLPQVDQSKGGGAEVMNNDNRHFTRRSMTK